MQLHLKLQFRAEVPLWVLPCLDTAYQVELRNLLAIVSGCFLLLVSHNICHLLLLSPILNTNITSQPSVCIQMLNIFCCHFFLAFPNFKHINKKSIKLRNNSMVVLLQINALRCLFLAEVSKITLTSKCCSSYSFERPLIILRLMWTLDWDMRFITEIACKP